MVVDETSLPGEYAPSPAPWVRDQVDAFERSGGTEGNALRGVPIVVMTMRGRRTGKIRKVPVMRVEHAGAYAVVASKGGADVHPVWYHNLVAEPAIELQDGSHKGRYVAREVTGDEKAAWWARAVEVWPDYAGYQLKTARPIPVFVLDPVR